MMIVSSGMRCESGSGGFLSPDSGAAAAERVGAKCALRALEELGSFYSLFCQFRVTHL